MSKSFSNYLYHVGEIRDGAIAVGPLILSVGIVLSCKSRRDGANSCFQRTYRCLPRAEVRGKRRSWLRGIPMDSGLKRP